MLNPTTDQERFELEVTRCLELADHVAGTLRMALARAQSGVPTETAKGRHVWELRRPKSGTLLDGLAQEYWAAF